MTKMPTPRWDLGTVLYRKVNTEAGGMLTGYVVRAGSAITYLIAWVEDGELEHFDFELSEDKVL